MKITISKNEAAEIIRRGLGNLAAGYTITEIKPAENYSPDLCTVTLEREEATLRDPEPAKLSAGPIPLETV